MPKWCFLWSPLTNRAWIIQNIQLTLVHIEVQLKILPCKIQHTRRTMIKSTKNKIPSEMAAISPPVKPEDPATAAPVLGVVPVAGVVVLTEKCIQCFMLSLLI